MRIALVRFNVVAGRQVGDGVCFGELSFYTNFSIWYDPKLNEKPNMAILLISADIN